MALVTDRRLDVREGLLFVDVTYDDATFRIERIYAECHVPSGAYVALHRGNSQNPWRETTLVDGEVYDESRPFGGGFNTLDQLEGIEIRVVF